MCTEQNAHDQALHVALEHGHQAVVVPCVELLGEAVPEVESDIREIVVRMCTVLGALCGGWGEKSGVGKEEQRRS